MNKTRRKALHQIIERVNELRPQLDELASLAESFEVLKDDLAALRDEEQEGFDNLSEKAQEGERGEGMAAVIEHMTAALDAIENVSDSLNGLDFDPDNVVEELDNACGDSEL